MKQRLFLALALCLVSLVSKAQNEVDTKFYDTFKNQTALFGCSYQAAAISLNTTVERWTEPTETPFMAVRLDIKNHSLLLGTTLIKWAKLIPDRYDEAVGSYETNREGSVLLQFDWQEEQNILYILVHEYGLDVCKLYYCQYAGSEEDMSL